MVYRYYTAIYGLTLLELEDIINNWNICLRIIITLIKESKNKILKLFYLKKNHYTCSISNRMRK